MTIAFNILINAFRHQNLVWILMVTNACISDSFYQKIINDIVSEKICFDFLILFVVDYATVNYISQTKCACSIFWKFCEIKNDENLANSGKTFLDRQTR